MDHDDLVITFRVVVALVLGGLIGMERTFHGRAAGFRTHALVCVASTLLMIITVYQNKWMTEVAIDAIRTDPTRMAQGIMTGIGFLGAGVIFKEGLTVRGLTTAASIWVTSAIGILVGVGFHFLAVLGTAATLIILSLFLLVERKVPAEFYAQHVVRFARDAVMSEDALRKVVASHGFSIADLSYRMTNDGKVFEYRNPRNMHALAQHLLALPEVIEFRISPARD
jgi:putative Mg2+ transporter-C (MgtC) family protein